MSKVVSKLGPMWLGMASPRMTEQVEPLIVERGEGVYVYDKDGHRMLDSQGGLWCVNIGHGRPEMKAAIVDQLDKIACYNNFVDTSNNPAIELSKKVIAMTRQENMARVMFCSGGSDANETALKLARQYWKLKGMPQRTNFISMQYGYHGVHFGGMSINGNEYYKAPYGPVLPGCYQIPSPFTYRNDISDDPAELAEYCAQKLEEKLLELGPETVAAFIGEPIQGAGGGVVIPPENYWPRIRQICDKYEVLLINDEVITGFGRSGAMFGSRGAGIKPDIMCLAKGISSGYIPLGATVVNQRVASAWEVDGPEGLIMHGFTYMGHPLACAAGLTALSIVEKEDLPANAAEVGAYFLQQLTLLLEKYEAIGDIRGKGLMLAIELVKDRATKEPLDHDDELPLMLSQTAMKRGLIIRALGNSLIMSPPLIFSKENADEAAIIIDQSFAAVYS